MAGEYKRALEIYATLYAETLHPTYLRNVGRCQQMLGNADEATDSFRQYLRRAKDLAPEERAEVEGFIRELQPRRRPHKSDGESLPPSPALAPRAAPPRPALPLSPAVVTRDERPAPSLHRRWWFWTGLGVLAVGAATTAVMLSRREPAYQRGSLSDLTVPPGN